MRPTSIEVRLKRIAAMAATAANWMHGHKPKPAFRREITENLKTIENDLRTVRRRITGEE